MRKTFEYNGIELIIEPASYYGHYWITAYFAEAPIKEMITDSSIYDWCDDDSDPEKHEQAKREAYGYITRAIEAAE